MQILFLFLLKRKKDAGWWFQVIKLLFLSDGLYILGCFYSLFNAVLNKDFFKIIMHLGFVLNEV